MNLKNLKMVLLIAVVAGLNVLIVIYPSLALDAARFGLLLWFNNVLPGILPFVVGANVLMALGVVKFLGIFLSPIMGLLFRLPGAAGFALAMGGLSGYPIGAKIVCEMRERGELNKNDAQRLLGFANNAGPLFILGAVAVGMFGSPALGYLLLLGHYVGALSLGFLLRFFAGAGKAGYQAAPPIMTIKKQPLGQILGQAVKGAMETMLIVGGFIVLFSVISALLSQLVTGNYQLAIGINAGLEMTGGLGLLSEQGITRAVAAVAAGILGFGGLSIIFQALSFIGKTDLSPSLYILCKMAHGGLAAAATFLLYPLFATAIENAATPAFAPSATRTLISSTANFGLALAALLIICLIAFVFRALSKK